MSFKFTGFATASAVALIVSQGAQSADINIGSWGNPQAGQNTSVQIEVDRHDPAIDPAQVWVKATGHSGLAAFAETGSVYDGAHHEYYHIWTINGEPLSDFSAPGDLPAEWNNPNHMNGREVAFCIPAGTDYVIDLVVVDRLGNSATASTSPFDVVAPETAFAEADRIYVDLDGAFPGKPAGSVGVNSLDGLKAALESAATPPWVLFERGETYDFGTLDTGSASGTGWLRISSARPIGYVSAYGAGASPVMVPSKRPERNQIAGMFLFWNTTPIQHFVMRDIEFVGDYNPVTETGSPGQGSCVSLSTNSNNGTFFTFHNVKCSGIDKAFQIQNNGANLRIMMSDVTVTRWRDYAIFGGQETDKIAIIGASIKQDPNATHGGDKGDSLVSTHAPVRIPNAASLFISKCSMFSRQGWSAGSGGRSDQPCLRLFTSPQDTEFGTVNQCVLKGGYHIINDESANPTVVTSKPHNLVIESNIMIANAKSNGTFFSGWRSGVTIRNNYMFYPSVQTLGAGTEAVKFALDGVESADNPTNPIRVYGNTYYNAMTAAQDGGGDFDFVVNRNNRFTNFLSENNVVHKPNATNSVNAGALDLSENLSVQTEYLGVRYGFDLPETLLPAGGWLNNGVIVLPYSFFTQALQDNVTTLGDNTTDQDYWEANGGPLHAVYVYDEIKKLYAGDGHFDVTFGPNDVTLTNTTGFTLGSGGEKLRVHLDRSAAIPAIDTTYASPPTIPIPRPTGNGFDIAPGSLSLGPDLFGVDRSIPAKVGAFAA